MFHPIRHFNTITKHRHAVIRHAAKAGILWQGLFHDLSKYSPSEFWVGALNYLGSRSPNDQERKTKGYSSAWLHHKGRNRHHFEYWTDYNPKTHLISPVKMPFKYVIEMFCDRVAASKIYEGKNYTQNHPIEYFIHAKKARFIHPETSAQLEYLLTMLAEKGEEETFRFLKKHKKGIIVPDTFKEE
ncbi:MAG: DUF5662 family protein [Bacillota bacterium]|nr:DUF5662 family protein [Bacillota bacterium]